MKLEEVIKQINIEHFSKDAKGFIIVSNKGDSQAQAIIGKFDLNCFVNIAITLLKRAIKHAPEKDQEDTKKLIVKLIEKGALDNYGDL